MSSTVADRSSEKSKDGVLFKRPGCKYTRFGLKRPHSTRQRVGRHVLVTCLTNTSNLASLKPSSPTNLFTLQLQIQKSPKQDWGTCPTDLSDKYLQALCSIQDHSPTCPSLKCQHKKWMESLNLEKPNGYVTEKSPKDSFVQFFALVLQSSKSEKNSVQKTISQVRGFSDGSDPSRW